MVAIAALIAAVALVAVPGSVGSRAPSEEPPVNLALFQAIEIAPSGAGPVTMTPILDAIHGSDGRLVDSSVLLEPPVAPPTQGRPVLDQPAAPLGVVVIPVWRYAPSVSFYGPGFYGHGTACGYAYTTSLMGVANRVLPCGTMVTFRNPANGRTITVPVVDRGPYVSGRAWDLTGAACTALGHCYTGGLYWKLSGG